MAAGDNVIDYPVFRTSEEVNKLTAEQRYGVHASDISITTVIEDQVQALPRKMNDIKKLEAELHDLYREVDLLQRLAKTVEEWKCEQINDN